MPRINRIRVNNVKYNFGTQFYDDFVLRFSCRNSIYDLANGGGKSVLMLLLLQNLIPNCTLDDKQPIEKLFRTNGASTTIHSLVEWNLEECFVHNGYKYMTTGFCARKAKETEENPDKESASIDYFNYVIFYKDFGENDIKNLPLVKNGERITYNGLKNYIRELDKKDFGVSAKVFEKKGDYQNFIAGYGLYESQWEIIRGINKTEGHVRTYFENNYKTTRKVVEDLLIEEIIEKSYNNTIAGDENGEEDMARTLLDIKDKLVELSQRKSEIESYDRQISLLNDFVGKLSGLSEIFTEKTNIKNELLNFLAISKGKLLGMKKNIEDKTLQKENADKEYDEAERVSMLAELAQLFSDARQRENAIEVINKKQKECEENINNMTQLLNRKEAAVEYFDYLENRKKRDEILAMISAAGLKDEDAAAEMKELCALKKKYFSKKMEEYRKNISEAKEIIRNLTEDIRETQKQEGEAYSDIKTLEGLRNVYASMREENLERAATLSGEYNLIVPEDAPAKALDLSQTMEKLKAINEDIEKRISENNKEAEDAKMIIQKADARLEMLLPKLSENEKLLSESESEETRIGQMKSIYNAQDEGSLPSAVEAILAGITRQYVNMSDTLMNLKKVWGCIKNGRIPDYGAEFAAAYDYLKGKYKSNILSGADILSKCDEDKMHELLEQYPQLPYVIVAKEAYEEIQSDPFIKELATGSFIIPVVREISDCTEIPGIYRDLRFMTDKNKCEGKLSELSEEIEQYEEKLRRLNDKCNVVNEDLMFVKYIAGKKKISEIREEIKLLKKENKALENQKQELFGKDAEIAEKNAQLFGQAAENKRKLSEYERRLSDYNEISGLCEKNGELSDKIRECEEQITAKKREHSNITAKLRDRKQKLSESEKMLNSLEKESLENEEEYREIFAPYEDENTEIKLELTEEECDARAGALISIIRKGAGDTNEKKKLADSYEEAMKKCIAAMKYKGYDPEELSELKKLGKLVKTELSELSEYRNRIETAKEEAAQLYKETEPEYALLNRVQGIMEHMRGKYTDRYGALDDAALSEIENPNAELISAKSRMSVAKENSLKYQKEVKELEKSYGEYYLMEKDLSRIIENSGIDAQKVTPLVSENMEISRENYEKVQKQYQKLQKNENSQLDAFVKDRQKLSDRLMEEKAVLLAGEIKNTLTVPKCMADIDEIENGIGETCECLRLEKDRTLRGISDMEKIRESFENRCIQICSNIKSELMRLSKLSKITLDEEQISIITLQIPYIREEMYSDRMTAYINETLSGTNQLSGTAEKLKYIKSRLSWKRLFSVVVTDMNSIRLSLYKREHIKNQSRYLRYEEAVGSTGQSQGIYIQFLIAIINYISCINAPGTQGDMIGKTIFIDNPFGAAKDVYIWEPIFKLLKTNHVQLIVPARGVTPSITKMFDVNYVLGQKLVAGRQQTVIVDYRSQIQSENMEYTNLDYEQITW